MTKTYYRVAVEGGWVGSPTDTVTQNPAFAATFNRQQAEMFAEKCGGKVEAGVIVGFRFVVIEEK